MSKIDDAKDEIQKDSRYIEPENFFSDSPTEDTIKRWSGSLKGFSTGDTVSPETEVDFEEIRQLYSENQEALRELADEIDVPEIDNSSPVEVLYIVYIRILQSKYDQRPNLNTHKYENLRDGDYSIREGGFESSNPVHLEPGTEYTASELRSIFNTQRAGRGIETRNDENDERYIRLFSTEESEYGDDLDADPMRYVGEKNFDDPAEDQVLKWGNGALAKSINQDWPIFLFEKVSDNPVTHLFRGEVEVVDYELNFRPQKDKREYDFYLRLADEDADLEAGNGDSEDDFAPGRLREVDPESRDIPDSEERISYESNTKTQAEALNTHEETVARLRDELQSSGWECKETEETDILAYTDTEALVIEVKSINDSNERKQLRKAIGQVFENCYRDVHNRRWGEKDQIPCIALSQVPSDRFSGYIEFLQAEGIDTLWITNDGIAGHPESVEKLLR